MIKWFLRSTCESHSHRKIRKKKRMKHPDTWTHEQQEIKNLNGWPFYPKYLFINFCWTKKRNASLNFQVFIFQIIQFTFICFGWQKLTYQSSNQKGTIKICLKKLLVFNIFFYFQFYFRQFLQQKPEIKLN